MDATTDAVTGESVNGKAPADLTPDNSPRKDARKDRKRFSTWLPEELLEQVRSSAHEGNTSIQAVVKVLCRRS